jgi:tRNA A-37 threonylcarbamoyl transferase component Bud32/membrane-associated phospholipid phosphatase
VTAGPDELVHQDRGSTTDVADDERPLILGGRRRPVAEARPFLFHLRTAEWTWLAFGVAVLAIWVSLFATGAPSPWLEGVDAAILDAAAKIRTAPLTAFFRVAAAAGSVWVLLALRWGTIAVLLVTQRLRHLATFVTLALVVRVVMLALSQAIGRPRPLGLTYEYGWEGYAHPSRTVAAFAVAAAGACFSLIPAGRARRIALAVAGAATGLLAVARVYLGVDHPSDVLFAAVIGLGAPVVAFRVFCPNGVFPVSYRGGRSAHVEIDGPREQRLREALDEQAGLELVSVETFGEEASGGSTPLRIRVRRSRGDEEVLFGKLYAEAHLRADRWFKLVREIRYGTLEDEVAFNSVRQLVEHEDHMLRVMNDAGVPTVRPRGFVELVAEREYVILMTFLHGADEADEDARIDEQVIRRALEVVKLMWEDGIAHRDIKPSNVMIREGHVRLIDVAFAQMRPSPWRQVVDLANMMLVLALASDARRVYDLATEVFEPEEIAEAFAATHGVTMPRQLRDRLREDGRDLVAEFRSMAPARPPIAIQRWSVRRVVITLRTIIVVSGIAVLVLANLANPSSP